MTQKSDKLENLLLSLVANNAIYEQSHLQAMLRENGVIIPQSTLSRWLKKLNIAKVNHKYQVVIHENLSKIVVLSLKVSLPNLIVLHTHPGNANALAYQLDQKMANATEKVGDPYAGVIGTIAGDDTVLVIMKNEESLLAFKQRLEQNTELHFHLLSGA